MDKMIKCHACGGKMVRDVRDDTVEYKGSTVTVEQPGWYCTGCDEVVFTREDAGVTEAAFVRLKADVDQILTSDEVRRIREKLGLSQRASSRLLGGGRKAESVAQASEGVRKGLDQIPAILEGKDEEVRFVKLQVGDLVAVKEYGGHWAPTKKATWVKDQKPSYWFGTVSRIDGDDVKIRYYDSESGSQMWAIHKREEVYFIRRNVQKMWEEATE